MKFMVKIQAMSMNHAYPSNRNGRRFLSNEGAAYKGEIIWAAKEAMRGADLMGRTKVTLEFFFNNKRRRDLDNCIKLLLDSMTGIVYKDDSDIQEIHAYRFYGQPAIIIKVEEFQSRSYAIRASD